MNVIEADCIAACIAPCEHPHDEQAFFPEAVGVRYYPGMARVVVSLSDGMDISFAPSDVMGLEDAPLDELINAEISPSRLAVRFPRLHVDLYIPGLMEGVVGSEDWLASRMAHH